jgi:uncharacterized coiled-coil DUF342 family protein
MKATERRELEHELQKLLMERMEYEISMIKLQRDLDQSKKYVIGLNEKIREKQEKLSEYPYE